MSAGKPAGTGSGARQHTIYCSAQERTELGARADAAGMSFSRYMVACALYGEDDTEDGTDGPRLVLGEDEQRELTRRVEELDRCTGALLKQLPGTELSALGALAFLVRAATGQTGDDGEERR